MALTPMMVEYMKTKEEYSDCILFYRLGDFYEMFFDDAITVSRELELVLTGKNCGLEERAPMCGIPHHAAAAYIPRLVNKGYKVAICEQLEDPKEAKGIVKRGVVKIITPGTFIDANSSLENDNTYLMTIYESDERIGLAVSDISTGEFKTTSFDNIKITLLDEISKVAPKEILVDKNISQSLIDDIKGITTALITEKDFNEFIVSKEEIIDQFSDLEVSGLVNEREISSRVLLKYIYETQKMSLTNINLLEQYEIINYMTIDGNSRRNLELTESIREKSKKGSLLWVLDKSATSMGGRTIRKWIEEPLIIKSEIEKRLSGVSEAFSSISFNEDLRSSLKDIYDIERIVGKISNKNVNAKDMLSLKASLDKLPSIKELLGTANSELLKEYYENLDELSDIRELLESSIKEEPSLSIKEGNIIKDGYNSEVDELRQSKLHGKEWIAALENREREFTGIKSLKVGYNKVFGYYIEISKSNYNSIPEGRYVRKQTLANAERYITEELKIMEDKILGAEEKLINLEYSLFTDIRDSIEKEIARLKKSARIISNLDGISTLALIALENDYVKPEINEDGIIEIVDGRHPVVEKVIGRGEFVSNNTTLNQSDKELLLITGPNMAGKSTYMRQVALITLMAQIGSFVPASSANISICDKIFTRIGASDDLAGGKSTFMVEMWEVSNILKNATSKSLVLLDEVGRGTSTYDGLSIAWSVIEYITGNENLRCKTLFATHYHELVKLEGVLPGVKNYSVAVKKMKDSVIFLRKIVEGGADESYGIEVAKLAGLPDDVINRAKEILLGLEGENNFDIHKVTNTEIIENEVAVDINQANNVVTITEKACESKSEYIEKVEAKDSFDKAKSNKDDHRIDEKTENSSKKHKNKDSSNNMQLDFTFIEKEAFLKEVSEVDILSLNPMEAMNTLYRLVAEAKKLK
ncbi:DNA mismatch repair protein MutS [Clostridium beijerinckii]|uniref:DNA mismatch repair protein MutS n=2 Tax=Clostridium beijerinckii TaxID=1520 RepID=MUTS_CLOB8|nr:DNA mismatch repair protein MutS [Clostridium beijerinckii]A6LWJ5.1 RecName: Full=DNA mismatch repair protein MutS [Clostridium beijerinckii NCIMB 8052]ABR34725.1 DNA mismatch repair protein MutS [Clostridium beijerinckii NCIMB 8052]AIU04088.1 DNA mismatch repair protein MutS [Clostridium beijerinckii ATCC 35702]ALB46181.1 DNA mismatch repair protein MutS [Clostridium beijerinckii NRRL B-598]MBF7810645.1 DNA mismatch repair protein MutS [Clostridium beijerinckii]NOW91366.1 DNA mismatch rep